MLPKLSTGTESPKMKSLELLAQSEIDLQKVGCGVMDWIELAQDSEMWQALLNAVMDYRFP
jgi:hypothetical protein